MGKALDLIGQRFGRLVVVGRDSRGGRVYWHCRCDCGTDAVVFGGSLRAKRTESCGCLSVEVTTARNLVHGADVRGKRSSEYRSWTVMRSRCNNPNDRNYPRYGARGIKVCERWESFENFIADLGKRPGPGHSIERVDNDKGYEPGNCRWADRTVQANNRRSNRRLTHAGQTKTVAEWAGVVGIPRSTIVRRIDRLGWSIDRALTTPVQIKYRHH